MIHDSAAMENVYVPGQILGQNAVTCLLVQLAMLPSVDSMHGAHWDRYVRHEFHGAAFTTAVQRGKVRVYEGTELRDLSTSAGKFRAAYETHEAATYRRVLRNNMVGGTIGFFTRPRPAWPYSVTLLPAGYAVEVTDPETGAPSAPYLCADTANTAGWAAFYQAFSRGESYKSCGEVLAEFNLPVRGQLNPGAGYRDVERVARTKAARTLTRARHLTALRDGIYVVRKSVTEPLGPDVHEWHEFPVLPGGAYGVIEFQVALPDHELELTDEEFLAWEQRLTGRESRAPRGPETLSLLAQTPAWWTLDGTHQQRIIPVRTSYQIRERLRETAFNGRGMIRGWTGDEGQLIASVDRWTAERALADLIDQAADQFLKAGTKFRLDTDTVQAQERAQAEAVTALADVELALDDARDDVEVATDALLRANPQNRQRREQSLSQAQARLVGLELEAERLRQQAGAIATTYQREIDLGQLATLAGVIRAGADSRTSLPRAVNARVRGIFGTSLRLTVHADNPRLMSLHGAVHMTTELSESVSVPVRTTLPNVCRLATAQLDRGEAVARLVLADGIALADACEKLGLTHDGGLASARSWLRQAGMRTCQGRRVAALECPVPATKQIIWRGLQGEVQTSDPQFVHAVIHAYFVDSKRWPQTWSGNTKHARQILGVFADTIAAGQDGSLGARVSRLAEVTGLTNAQINRLADERRSGACAFLERHPDLQGTIRPRRCKGCGRALVHVIRTPETASNFAVACTTCRTLGDGTPLPAAYFDHWDTVRIDDPSATVNRNHRTVLVDPRNAHPRLPTLPGTPRLRVGQAAKISGISPGNLRAAANNGLLRTYRAGADDQRTFEVADLMAYAAAVAGTGKPFAAEAMLDGHITIDEAVRTLGVPASHLRALAWTTPADLPPLRYQKTRDEGRHTWFLNDGDLEALDPDWLAHARTAPLSMQDFRLIYGLSHEQVKRALKTGSIPHTVNKRTHLIERADADAWINGVGRGLDLLQPHQAAARAGTTDWLLRRAVDRGELKVIVTANGRLRFDPREIDEWAASRDTPTVPGK